MSPRKKTSLRRLLPSVVLVFVFAGLTTLILKHYSNESQPRATSPREVESQKGLPVPGPNGRLINLGVTNQPSAEGHEDRVVALTTEGTQLLAQGKPAEAAQKFEQAVAISPDQEDLHYNLAIALAKLGKTDNARKHYEEALRIFPDYGDAHNNLGSLLMNENKLEEAIDQFRQAISNSPENASFHNNLGTAFGRQGKVAEAIVEFEQAIKQTPTYVEARVNLAMAFLATGRVEEAIPQLNEALRLKPDFKPALQAMQRARQRQESRK